MKARIAGIGAYAPERVVTNDQLSEIVDTSDEWIRSRTGISERRISTGETTRDLAAEAARRALKAAGVDARELDIIILGTSSPDNNYPSDACSVQAMIGAENAVAFDISAACDGAGAAVLKAEETGVVDMLMGSDGTKGPVLSCTSRTLGNFLTGTKPELGLMTMDGQEVFRFAVKKVPESIEILLERNHISREEIKYYVLHQANERIVEAAARRLKEPMEKFPMTISKYGNTSSASIPLLLNDMAEKNMLQPGDKIILSGFGAGMTWGAVLMEW